MFSLCFTYNKRDSLFHSIPFICYSLVQFQPRASALGVTAGHKQTDDGGSPQLVVAEWSVGSAALLEDRLHVHVELELLRGLGTHVPTDYFRHDGCGWV